jgi:hypothetical protein
MDAYSLSKIDLQLGFGKWLIKEVSNGEVFEFYH